MAYPNFRSIFQRAAGLPALLTIFALALSACTPAAPTAAVGTPIPVALATQAPTATGAPSATASPTPTATATQAPPPPLLPAPAYFLSDQGGVQQIWRIEMNAGFAHPVTSQPAGIDSYDINPVDGRLVFVSNNDLYVAKADGSGAQMIIDGETLVDPTFQPEFDLRLTDPVWSPDGGAIAFARNGLNVITLPSMYVQNLLTNVPFDQNAMGNRRFYSPLFWSPDGAYLAVLIGYYEGAEMGIIPAAGGQMMDAGLPTCCATRGPNDASFFVGALNGMDTGGLWQVQWNTGRSAQLSPVPAETQYPPIYGYPQLGDDGKLYMLFGSETVPQIVRTDPLDLTNKEVLGQLTYMPGPLLWAPDGSLMILPCEKPGEPLQLWQPGQEPAPLEMPGTNLKWGPATEADVALAQTPVPTFTPTPTLPPLPDSSQVITRENVAQLQPLTTIGSKNDVYSLAISPDNRTLALGLELGVELWNLASMQRTARLGPYGGLVSALAFSPDARYVAAGSWDRSLDLWDAASAQKVRPFTGHTDWVTALAFSPDGALLASTGNDNKLFVWDAASGSPVWTVDLGHWASDVSFSPDGALLAVTGWDTGATIYNVSDWSVYAGIPYQPDRFALNLQFSPDGRTLALGTWDYRVVLWDVPSQSQRNEMFGHTDNPTGLAFSPDGSLLASAAEGGEMRIWDAATGGQLNVLPGDRNAAFSPDGRFLIAGGPSIAGAVVYYVP